MSSRGRLRICALIRYVRTAACFPLPSFGCFLERMFWCPLGTSSLVKMTGWHWGQLPYPSMQSTQEFIRACPLLCLFFTSLNFVFALLQFLVLKSIIFFLEKDKLLFFSLELSHALVASVLCNKSIIQKLQAGWLLPVSRPVVTNPLDYSGNNWAVFSFLVGHSVSPSSCQLTLFIPHLDKMCCVFIHYLNLKSLKRKKGGKKELHKDYSFEFNQL